MSRLQVAVAVTLAGALGGCDLPGGSSDADGLQALREARAKARAAPYLTVSEARGREERFAPGLTVIRRKGSVLLWETPDVSYTIDKAGRCYYRTTEFERADLREVRRDAVVAEALIDDAELAGSEDHRSIRWHGPIAEEGYRVEGEVDLDHSGRPVRTRERTNWLGGRPPEPWYERRYSYPSSGERGHPPSPRC